MVKMVYLECDILGNNKKIEIESIEYGNDDKVIKYDDTHYYYNVDKKHQKSFKILLKILNLLISYFCEFNTLISALPSIVSEIFLFKESILFWKRVKNF